MTGCNTINELIAACASPTEEALTQELILDVFPNPTEDLISIEFNQPGTYQVEFYNVLGQLIRLGKVVGTRRTFNIAAFDKGLYFAIVSSENGLAELVFEKQ